MKNSLYYAVVNSHGSASRKRWIVTNVTHSLQHGRRRSQIRSPKLETRNKNESRVPKSETVRQRRTRTTLFGTEVRMNSPISTMSQPLEGRWNAETQITRRSLGSTESRVLAVASFSCRCRQPGGLAGLCCSKSVVVAFSAGALETGADVGGTPGFAFRPHLFQLPSAVKPRLLVPSGHPQVHLPPPPPRAQATSTRPHGPAARLCLPYSAYRGCIAPARRLALRPVRATGGPCVGRVLRRILQRRARRGRIARAAALRRPRSRAGEPLRRTGKKICQNQARPRATGRPDHRRYGGPRLSLCLLGAANARRESGHVARVSWPLLSSALMVANESVGTSWSKPSAQPFS